MNEERSQEQGKANQTYGTPQLVSLVAGKQPGWKPHERKFLEPIHIPIGVQSDGPIAFEMLTPCDIEAPLHGHQRTLGLVLAACRIWGFFEAEG